MAKKYEIGSSDKICWNKHPIGDETMDSCLKSREVEIGDSVKAYKSEEVFTNNECKLILDNLVE